MNSLLNDLKEIWNKDKGNSLSVYLKNNSEADNYFSEMLKKEPWFENKRKLFSCLIKGITAPIHCKHCGKILSVDRAKDGKQYCSHKCAGHSEERLNKVKITSLQRYGTENAFQNKKIQEKQKKTCIKKYGTENIFQLEEVKEKSKQTCIEKYGTEFAGQNEQIKEKIKQSNLLKYGVEYASQNEEVKNKKEKTNLERYGTKSPSQNEQVKQKMKHTCLEKYGVDCTFKDKEIDKKRQDTWKQKSGGNPLQNEEIKEKKRATCLKKFGADNYGCSPYYFSKKINELKERWKDYIIPLFSDDEFQGANQDIVYRWKCVKCGNEFEQRIYTTSHIKDLQTIPRCPICYPHISGYSHLEKEVLEFIKSIYQGEIIENDRKTIKPMELDIVIPEKHLAIEFDGLFWHSENSGKDRNYHLNKTEFCKKQGYQLIHIFEDEWINQRFIIEDRIKSLLGIYDKRIYARKCETREVDSKTSNEFLETNHLQGKDNASVRYGLYYQGELVSIMTFGKPRFNKKYDFELIRFASKLGTQVIGGFSKLLKYFERNFSNASIISYADRRFSKGNVYEKSGFTFVENSKPNYFYIRKLEKYTRYQCQKHKLKNILRDKFNPNLSESENMLLNGYSRVYDCGNSIYIIR